MRQHASDAIRRNLAAISPVSGIMYRLTSFCFHPVIRFRRSVPFCKYMYIPYLTTILESRYVAIRGLTAFLQDYPHQHSNRFVFRPTTRRIESVVLLSRSQIIYHFTAIYIDRSQIHISRGSRRYSKDVKHLCID